MVLSFRSAAVSFPCSLLLLKKMGNDILYNDATNGVYNGYVNSAGCGCENVEENVIHDVWSCNRYYYL